MDESTSVYMKAEEKTPTAKVKVAHLQSWRKGKESGRILDLGEGMTVRERAKNGSDPLDKEFERF